jgi:hypothetical protein
MDIKYATRSKFLDSCEAAIRRHRARLDAGDVVEVHLVEEKPRYAGRVLVTIRPGDRAAFGTDWNRADPSRFPARIKAAANGLLNCCCQGRFEVSHLDGLLTIRSM